MIWILNPVEKGDESAQDSYQNSRNFSQYGTGIMDCGITVDQAGFKRASPPKKQLRRTFKLKTLA